MINDPISGELKSFDFNHMYNQIPELNRIPVSIDSVSIDKPIDSSEMTPEHWLNLVDIIESNYNNYDGGVTVTLIDITVAIVMIIVMVITVMITVMMVANTMRMMVTVVVMIWRWCSL